MARSPVPPDPVATRALAWTSGVVGLLAGLLLVGSFTLDSYGVRLAGFSLGRLDDILGTVQFAALAPVAAALGGRLPHTRTIRVATAVGVVAMVAFVVLGILLVTDVLTFATQIGPVLVAIVAIYGWLLLVNLRAHRTRTLPRPVTRTGVLVGSGLFTGLVLVGAAYVVPGIVGRAVLVLGYGVGGLAWLSLPVYVLLLARLVFAHPSPAATVAAAPLEGIRS
jgi:hypothetical protein